MPRAPVYVRLTSLSARISAKLRDRRARLVLLQNADDLFVCKTVALHSLVLSMGQSLLQNGLFQRGKVTSRSRASPFLRSKFLIERELASGQI
ncbi:hypothetical protein A6U92_05585 [Agrobacterium rubi]|nr:hypothetical protein A6U92_05585 [Agrobacterium rubi]